MDAWCFFRCVVHLSEAVTKEQVAAQQIDTEEGLVVNQKTPIRVLHRCGILPMSRAAHSSLYWNQALTNDPPQESDFAIDAVD